MKDVVLTRWQLSLLVTAHFITDVYGGIISGALPALIISCSLTVAGAALLPVVAGVVSNIMQLFTGALGKHTQKPILLALGLAMSCAVLTIGLVRPGNWALYLLVGIGFTFGVGSAIVHPEGLRGVCALPEEHVRPELATSLFMMVGFLGTSLGVQLGGIAGKVGLKQLLWLTLPIALLIFGIFYSGLKLAVGTRRKKAEEKGSFTFWELFALALILNTGCAIIQTLLPVLVYSYHVVAEEHNSIFSSTGVMLFGFGTGFGAIMTSAVWRKYWSAARCVSAQLVLGFPLLILYFALAPDYPWATALLFPAGALIASGYPLMVALAQSAECTLEIGTRMAIMVGATWGLAALLVQLTAVLERYIGLQAAVHTSLLYFALDIMLLLAVFLKRRRKKLLITQAEDFQL